MVIFGETSHKGELSMFLRFYKTQTLVISMLLKDSSFELTSEKCYFATHGMKKIDINGSNG